MVARRHARAPGPPWPFVLHVVTCAHDHKVIFGDERQGDPDLLMHYAVCRAAGIAVRGPAPTELIGHIARVDVLGYLCAELRWALDHAYEAYGVLNARRALAYLERDEILSKVDGAQYALQRGAPQELIVGALAMHHGDRPHNPPSDAARRFITDTAHALEAQRR
jgi:streptomycin 3"-adenylyltransferase